MRNLTESLKNIVEAKGDMSELVTLSDNAERHIRNAKRLFQKGELKFAISRLSTAVKSISTMMRVGAIGDVADSKDVDAVDNAASRLIDIANSVKKAGV